MADVILRAAAGGDPVVKQFDGAGAELTNRFADGGQPDPLGKRKCKAPPRIPSKALPWRTAGGLVAPSGLCDQPAGLDAAAPVARLLHASRSITAVVRFAQHDGSRPLRAALRHQCRIGRPSAAEIRSRKGCTGCVLLN